MKQRRPKNVRLSNRLTSALSSSLKGVALIGLLHTVFVGVVAQAKAPSCEAVFLDVPLYRLLHRGTQADGHVVRGSQERTLVELEKALTSNGRQKINLTKFIPTAFADHYGLAIDLSGGTGKAMFQLAQSKGVHVVAISPTDMTPDWDRDLDELNYHSTFTPRIGWAQEILPQYKGQASLITDVKGEFTKAGMKLELLAQIYETLTQDGQALIAYNKFESSATIQTSQGSMDLIEYLRFVFPEEQYPGLFDIAYSSDPTLPHSMIIQIKRLPGLDQLRFNARLKDVQFKPLLSRLAIHPASFYVER